MKEDRTSVEVPTVLDYVWIVDQECRACWGWSGDIGCEVLD